MNLLADIKYSLYKKKLVHEGQRKARNTKPMLMNEPIDFVVTWVNGSDPEWLSCKEKCQAGVKTEKDTDGECRYRDWELFRYWFRAVEKYAPWVNNVYLVTYGHVPEWLNLNAPKLKFITHKDYIPEQYLPTFNCDPIELNLHRIKGLSEHFVYFNDDVFLNQPVVPEDFFRGGEPNYTAVARPLINTANDAFTHMQFSAMAAVHSMVGNEVSKRIEAHPEKWFTKEYGEYYVRCNLCAFDQNYLPGMLFPHLGVAFKKSIMEKVWAKIPEQLHKTCLNKIRTPTDVFHQVFSTYAMLEGEFNPVSKEHHGRVFPAVPAEQDNIIAAIVNGSCRAVCINDSELLEKEDYLKMKELFRETFEKALPEKSQYEK